MTTININGHNIRESSIYCLLYNIINQYFYNNFIFDDYMDELKKLIKINPKHDYIISYDGYYIPYNEIYKNYLKDNWDKYHNYIIRLVHNQCVKRGMSIDDLPTKPTIEVHDSDSSSTHNYIIRLVHNQCVKRGMSIDDLPTKPTIEVHDSDSSSTITLIVSIIAICVVVLIGFICALV